MNIPYPQKPIGTQINTAPSASFRKGVMRTIFALVLFAITYIILLAAGIAFAVLLGIVGGGIIINIRHFLGIAFGAGLIVVGCMVLYFLVKFIFEKKTDAGANYIEITEEEQPALFEFVRRLSAETGTDFPKHIYISHEVNASVFYNSTFLSMVVPVRKNLLIGLGLVNSVNISELKAILAHEFGHFSQKSMLAGSYVYQVNRAIYNMLYENKNYGELLERWASIHGIFALCARFTVSVVNAIQYIQRGVYTIVNKQYLALSREMEFHADTIAASVSGSNNMISALRRIEFGNACYDNTLEKYGDFVKSNLKATNLFEDQLTVVKCLSREFRLQLHNDLPLLDNAGNLYTDHSRVSILNTWDTHPSRDQREKSLNDHSAIAEVDNTPAWAIFQNVEELQQKLTRDLYKEVQFSSPPQPLEKGAFQNAYEKDVASYGVPAIYDHYFKNRNISKFDPAAIPATIDEIDDAAKFFSTNTQLNRRISAANADIALLDQIISDKTIRRFSFDGKIYRKNSAAEIKAELVSALEQQNADLCAKDQQQYWHFRRQAANAGSNYERELTLIYEQYFEALSLCESHIAFCGGYLAQIAPFFDEAYRKAATEEMFQNLKDTAAELKEKLKTADAHFFTHTLYYCPERPDDIFSLYNREMSFMIGKRIAFENINKLWEFVVKVGAWHTDVCFEYKKALLEKQLQLSASLNAEHAAVAV